MPEAINDLYAEEYLTYLRKRGTIQKIIRKFYLRDIRSLCVGKTIDFGCGIGELLKILPDGSIGFEINKQAVDYCKSQGLKVSDYDPDEDNYQFKNIHEGEYSSFTMNHVLEHIENSYKIIKILFESCARIGIQRIVFTVPGINGYNSDKTHRTFIDMKYLGDNGLLENKNYKLRVSKYFPINFEKFGHYFRHNELRIVFDKRND